MPTNPSFIAIIIIGLIAVLCLIKGIYETFVLKVSSIDFGEGNKGLKIVLFSDVHAQYMHVPIRNIIFQIKKYTPDIILFGGDITNAGSDKEKRKAIKIFSKISYFAKENSIPFYGVFGNHDNYNLNEDFKKIPELSNFSILKNESIVLNTKDNSKWVLTGLDDLRIGNPDYDSSVKNLSEKEKLLPEVILAHNPDTVFSLPQEVYKNCDSKLFLSGHFHGGQIWMPFNLEYKVLRTEVMADMGNRKGAFKLHGLSGYISRGLGCVIVPLRFFSYPELVTINFFAKDKI